MKWIGLTGGIATGKSTAKLIIEKNKIPVIDADQIAHQISQPGQLGFEKIKSAFDKTILDRNGYIDRHKLGEIVFKSNEEKLRLELILHPMIQIEVAKQKKYFSEQGNKICFYDVPLLFEKKLQTQFDSTVLIWCETETQRIRLINRNNLTHQQATLRIKSQLPLQEKLPLATFCIDNSTTIESLELQMNHLFKKIAV